MSAKRVVITGASGLIGGALTASLRADGVEVTHLVRRAPAAPHEVRWQPGTAALAPAVLAGAAAVVRRAALVARPWSACCARCPCCTRRAC